MKTTMLRTSRPWLGVLLFWSLSLSAGALEVPREILLEVRQPITLSFSLGKAQTGLPDLDAFLSQNPDLETQYALPYAQARHPNFNRFLLLRLSPQSEGKKRDILQRLAQLASVRWAQSNHQLRSNDLPNDPFYGQQWGLARIGAPAAWQTTTGSPAIPISIIDTGCEMVHPDLVGSFWKNMGENANADTLLDSSDFNGIDDDGNGYIDDFHGWDFVDAPTFPSTGDYLVRDNDPSDENGHGTALAGLCGAVQNNAAGISGLAPNCPLMILRAGNANGYLQEDDVASAMLYALDNGARVVNMSFGDTEASPMLEDVVNYATAGGLVLVAASGNMGNTTIIFPAAYGSILCVGACNQNDQRSSFSSYGTSLDLLAPGSAIYSTALDGEYGYTQGGNGTSFSAAFASAAAGLVLSQHPSWNPAMVSSALRSTTDDLPPSGWDMQTGQGILRVDRAVQLTEALVAEILTPQMQQSYVELDSVIISGTAAGLYFDNYRLYYGLGENPSSWNEFTPANRTQVVNEFLGILMMIPEPTDTAYSIRLEVEDIFGNTIDDRTVIYFDPSAPVISNLSVLPILDGDRPAYLFHFNTDDLTTGKIWLHAIGGPITRWLSQSLNYASTDHTLLIGENLGSLQYYYYLWVQNSAGLVAQTEILDTLDLTQTSIATNNFVEQPPCGLPPAYLYEESTDLDQDGRVEVWADSLTPVGSKDSLYVWEAPTTGFTFTKLDLNYGKEIPKSIGDSNADSLKELLTQYGGRSKIFAANSTPGFPQPSNVIWSDTNNVWGVRLLDLVPEDDQGEFIVVSGGQYQLWRHPATGAPEPVQNLVNPFGALTFMQPPYCRQNDYDDDGLPDLLFGDYSGNLFIYERTTDQSFTLSWKDSTELLDTGEFLTDGDYDGDGQIEFAVAAHTETVLGGEHLADTRYWALFLYKATGNNQYERIDTLYFFGAEDPLDFASGISSGNVYGDAPAEILLCVYPDMYVLAWDSVKAGLEAIWYYPECRSNKAVIGDFNDNGHPEFLFNTGATMKVFEEFGLWAIWPPPPQNFRATAPDTVRVNLHWNAVNNAYQYNLYKSTNPEALGDTAYAVIASNILDTTDFNVEKDTIYYYAISTTSFSVGTYVEGPKSVTQTVTPNTQPSVVGNTARYVSPNFVILDFNEPMGTSLLNPNNYWVNEGMTQPNSVVSDAGGTRAVLTFDLAYADSAFMVDTTYRIFIYELFDLQGSPLSSLSDTLYFSVSPGIHIQPYLKAAYAEAYFSEITLEFSQPMDQADLTNESFYSISQEFSPGQPAPGQILITTAVGDSSPTKVHLHIDPKTPLGAQGLLYRLTASPEIQNSTQTANLDSTHNTAILNFTTDNLKSVFVYPNPYSSDTRIGGAGYVMFANVTPDVEVRIYSLQGILIKTLKANNNVTGGVQWWLDNDKGESVGSGVYLYYVSNADQSIWGKIAVLR